MTEATAEITEIKSENEELLRKLNTAKAAKKDAEIKNKEEIRKVNDSASAAKKDAD